MAMTMANQRQEKAMRLGRIVTHSNIHHPSRRLATCSRVHARPLDGERRRNLCRKTRRACGVASGYGHRLRNDPLQTVRDQFIQDGKLVEETVWFDDLPVAVLKPKGASATSPVSGTGNVATNNQDANNTGTNGNTAPPAAPTAKVNVEVFYVHPDHLGTPRVITASTALAATTGTGITSPQTVNKAVWRWDSDPFGSNATANSAPNENPNTLSQVVGTATLPYLFGFDLAFPGQKRDRETGKHYNYFRDYDPAVGRYFESDPIGLDGGLCSFAYTDDSPLIYRDPLGLQFVLPPGNVGAASGGLFGACCRNKPNDGGSHLPTDATGVPPKSNAPPIWNTPAPPSDGDIIGDAPVPPFTGLGSLKDCKVGRQMVEPALGKRYKGGVSIQQEYFCPCGQITRHTIIVGGAILHDHFRAGPPKPGGD